MWKQEYFREAKAVLNPDWFDTYKNQVELIGNDLVLLGSSLQILKTIDSLPFQLFGYTPDDDTFLTLICRSLRDSCVIVATRVGYDKDSRVLKLQVLRDGFLKNLRNDLSVSKRQQIKNAIDNVSFDERIKATSKIMKGLRNTFIAHRNNKVLMSPEIYQEKFYTADMDEIANILTDLFGVLTFNPDQSYVPLDYGQVHIYQIFDSLVYRSARLRLPEEDLVAWLNIRLRLSDKQVMVFNSYRRKFGMDEA